MLDLVWTLCSYVLYCLLGLALYMVFTVVIQPYLMRRHYRKYSNVHISDEYLPIMGNFIEIMGSIKNGFVYYHHLRTNNSDICKKDMRLDYEASEPVFKMVSHQAHQGLSDLIPSKIDRYPDNLGFGKMTLTAFSQVKTVPQQKKRRAAFMKLLSLNSSSRYIPDFIDCMKDITKEWKNGESYKCVKEMNYFTFTVFMHVLFGKDLQHFATHEVDYINGSNQIEKLPFREFFILVTKDLAYGWVHPLTLVLPLLNEYNLVNPFKRNLKNEYNLVNPFKRNLKNVEVFRTTLHEITSKCKDEGSIYYKLTQDKDNKEEDIFEDIIAFMLAGTETSSHAIGSAIYFLKKNPKCLTKLMDEFESNGFSRSGHSEDYYSLDNIHKMDYLNYVVKEALRIDTPGVESLLYKTKENVVICGVPIKKNTHVSADIVSTNYNPYEWQKPHEFIPERFDPESEYFKKPESENGVEVSKSRAFMGISFTYGERKCPGQSFALIEIKVALTYLLTHFEFNVAQEFLEKKGVGFAIGSEDDINMKITKLDC